MGRKFIIEEEELRDLLDAWLEKVMNERDGVDNWCWYGSSYKDVIIEYHPEANNKNAEEIGFEGVVEYMIEHNYDVYKGE